MRMILATLLAMTAICSVAAAAQSLPFWNLTSFTITGLYLAPTGTDHWGTNQCDNDPDKSVSSDERLKITGVTPGRYDVRITDGKGRVCIVRNVEVKPKGPYAFSISDKDLTGCTK
jgi:hypothetical protein